MSLILADSVLGEGMSSLTLNSCSLGLNVLLFPMM